jgi:hypothetical protein
MGKKTSLALRQRRNRALLAWLLPLLGVVVRGNEGLPPPPLNPPPLTYIYAYIHSILYPPPPPPPTHTHPTHTNPTHTHTPQILPSTLSLKTGHPLLVLLLFPPLSCLSLSSASTNYHHTTTKTALTTTSLWTEGGIHAEDGRAMIARLRHLNGITKIRKHWWKIVPHPVAYAELLRPPSIRKKSPPRKLRRA